MDQKRLALLQRPALEHIVPDRHQRFRDGAGLQHRQARWYRHRLRILRDAILRVAAAGHQRHHLVAELVLLRIGPKRDHFARHLEAGQVACAGRRRVMARALRDIGAVDACGHHLDQDFALARNRHRPGFGDEHLGAARLADADNGHLRRQLFHDDLSQSLQWDLISQPVRRLQPTERLWRCGGSRNAHGRGRPAAQESEPRDRAGPVASIARGAQRADRASDVRDRAVEGGRYQKARLEGRGGQLLQAVRARRHLSPRRRGQASALRRVAPSSSERDPGSITTGLHFGEGWEFQLGATTRSWRYGSPHSRGRPVPRDRAHHSANGRHG